MHPDISHLAAYLDGALPEAQRAALRGHVLACATCTARLERLRADEGRIQNSLAAVPTLDIRAGVHRRLRQRTRLGGFGKGSVLAGAALAVLLLAVFAGLTGGAFGSKPDRLFVADYAGSALLALDASNGAQTPPQDLTSRTRRATPARLPHNQCVARSPLGDKNRRSGFVMCSVRATTRK